MIRRNKVLVTVISVLALVCAFSYKIPFFWDGTFFSTVATYFYFSGFNGFIAPADHDTGGFPLFSVYLAIAWKIFSRTLLVSHLAMIPIVLGAAVQYYRLAAKFLDGRALILAMILLVIEPAFLTQSILMGYDVMMVFCFLLALNALLENKKWIFSIALLFLCMSSMRGIVAGIALLFIDAFISKYNTLKFFIKYLPAIIILLSWNAYHHLQTGWMVFSPVRQHSDEALNNTPMVLKQGLYFFWRLLDNGKVVFFLFVLLAWYKIRNVTYSAQSKKLIIIFFFPAICFFILMISFANPIGPRYFIVLFLLINLIACYFIQLMISKTEKIVWFLVLFCSSLTGHFWLYPSPYGNSWDSTLKVLPFFKAREKMDAFVSAAGIGPDEIGTQFPLISDKTVSHLSNTSYRYTNVWRGPVEKFKYYLHSNVINTDIPDQMKTIERDWELLYSEVGGLVWLRLYRQRP